MIRISLRGARDKNVDVLTQDPHDQTSGHIEQLRHQIHNLLPLSQNRVWNRWYWMMIWRNLVPAGSYFFHRASILCGLRERISRKDAKTQRQPRIYANQNGEKHEPQIDQPSSGSRQAAAGLWRAGCRFTQIGLGSMRSGRRGVLFSRRDKAG